MKKLLNFSIVATLLAVTSCVVPDITLDGPNVNVDGVHKVQIQGAIDQLDNTRVDDNGFCTGDVVGLYLVNYEGEQPGNLLVEENQADNVKFTYGEDGTWTSEYDIYYKDNDTKVDFYGYYPYATPSSIEEYAFEVAKDQRTPAEHGQMAAYEASDFLWAKVEGVTPTASKVNMKFNHKLSSARVRFIQGEGWADAAEFAAVKKEVLVTNTIRKSTINLATGVVTPTGEMPLDGIIPVEDGGDFRAIVVPQTVEAGKSVLVLTIDGRPRHYARAEATEYLPGKITNFDMKIKKSAATGEYEVELVGVSITAWEADNTSHQDDAREYVVVHCPMAGQLERTMVDRLEMDVTKIKNLKLTGSIGTDDYTFMRSKMTSLMRVNLREVESKIDGVYKIPLGGFYGRTTLVKCVLPEKLERIEGGYTVSNPFQGTSLTGTLQLPEGLKYVAGFRGTKITNVIFPQTLEEIGEYAFYDCNSLMCEISLPASLKRIGQHAFESSAIRGNLSLPEGLEDIGSGAFAQCSGLTGSLKIPQGIKVIKNHSFSSTGFNGNLVLPDGLVEIGSSAFSDTHLKGDINIPSTVTIIGSHAFYSSRFTGTVNIPKELITLGSAAFGECQWLTGTIEIPKNIISVPSSLCYGCRQIKGVVLHKDIEVIESSAFSNCYYITSFVCKAKNPPTVGSSAFSGVAKDNFTIEVPEDAVKKYENASGWSEFKRIAAHKEFSISRNLLRTLNAAHSKMFTVRALAGEAWSVESAPEWVTVTPSSGVGKMDVTITVNEMATGDVGTFDLPIYNDKGVQTSTEKHKGRKGEVVFLLDGKGYRVRMAVEQYDYQYGDGDLITHQTATIGNGVNIVLMGDCFDAKDISEGKYLKAVQDAYGYFFDVEPYLTYKDYFNVYSIFGMSADSGMGTVNTIREARFGSQYFFDAGVQPDYEIIFAAACKAPINDDVAKTLIIVVENTNQCDGVGALWGDGTAVALATMSTDPSPRDFRGVVHHEANGHGFGKLADEYIYHNYFVSACELCGGDLRPEINRMKSYGFYTNISLTGNMKEVPWSHMIYDPQYSNVVDVYEGAFMHTRGVFRSEATSCMNNNIPYFNAISRESIVKRIMKYAGEPYSYEAFKAKDYESLPKTTATETRAWEGVGVKASSQFDQRPPKFMGEKPQFDKKKF